MDHSIQLISLEVNQDWTLHHLDIFTAYLNGELIYQVLMKKPLEYANKGRHERYDITNMQYMA